MKLVEQDTPEISVVVPIYNVEAYLEKCVDSILVQTFDNFELILVNDGSSDSSGSIMNDYGKRDSRIRIIHHSRNEGLSAARNSGMRAAKGNYIIFVDSDDWVDGSILAKMHRAIKREDADICVCNAYRIDEDRVQTQTHDDDYTIDLQSIGRNDYIIDYMFGQKHKFPVWNRLYKLSLLRRGHILFFPNDQIYSEDLLFNLECALHGKSVTWVNEPLYYHAIRERSITTSFRPDIVNRLMRLCRLYEKKLIAAGKWPDMERSFHALVQKTFYMAAWAMVRNNRFSLHRVLNGVQDAFQWAFFKASMKQASKHALCKDWNFTSFLLSMNLKLVPAVCIFVSIRKQLKSSIVKRG